MAYWIVSVKLRTFPASNRNPFFLLSISSDKPPISEEITGVPNLKDSMTISPNVSYHSEGTIV